MNKKILSFFAATLFLAGNIMAMELLENYSEHYQKANDGSVRIECVPYFPFLERGSYTKKDIITIEKLNQIIKQEKDNITAIDFRSYNEYINREEISWENGKWTELTNLKELICYNSDIPKNVLKIIIANNQNLTYISLVCIRSRPLLGELPFKNIKKLETFDISGHTLTDQVYEFNNIIINNPNLKDLKISFCDKFPWKNILWKKLESLGKLSFIFTDITKDDLETILKIHPNLTLNINICQNISVDDAKDLKETHSKSTIFYSEKEVRKNT